MRLLKKRRPFPTFHGPTNGTQDFSSLPFSCSCSLLLCFLLDDSDDPFCLIDDPDLFDDLLGAETRRRVERHTEDDKRTQRPLSFQAATHSFSRSDPPPQVASRLATRTSSARSNASPSPHSSPFLPAFVPPLPGSFQTSRLAQPSMLALQASKCQSGIVPSSLLLSC